LLSGGGSGEDADADLVGAGLLRATFLGSWEPASSLVR